MNLKINTNYNAPFLGAFFMKKFLLYILILILFSCSEKENLTLFSPEAYAFELDSGWELNSSVNLKGFTQIETNDTFSCNISYLVNLITPEKDTLNQFDFGSIVEKQEEDFIDLTIDVQANLDSNFSIGTYKLIFIVTDEHSGKTSTIEKTFELIKN